MLCQKNSLLLKFINKTFAYNECASTRRGLEIWFFVWRLPQVIKQRMFRQHCRCASSIKDYNWAAIWKTNKVTGAPSADSDQPGIWSVISVRLKNVWVLSYPLSAQQRLIRLGGWPGWSIFAGHTGHFVGFVMRWLNLQHQSFTYQWIIDISEIMTSFTVGLFLATLLCYLDKLFQIFYTLLNLALPRTEK